MQVSERSQSVDRSTPTRTEQQRAPSSAQTTTQSNPIAVKNQARRMTIRERTHGVTCVCPSIRLSACLSVSRSIETQNMWDDTGTHMQLGRYIHLLTFSRCSGASTAGAGDRLVFCLLRGNMPARGGRIKYYHSFQRVIGKRRWGGGTLGTREIEGIHATGARGGL